MGSRNPYKTVGVHPRCSGRLGCRYPYFSFSFPTPSVCYTKVGFALSPLALVLTFSIICSACSVDIPIFVDPCRAQPESKSFLFVPSVRTD